MSIRDKLAEHIRDSFGRFREELDTGIYPSMPAVSRFVDVMLYSERIDKLTGRIYPDLSLLENDNISKLMLVYFQRILMAHGELPPVKLLSQRNVWEEKIDWVLSHVDLSDFVDEMKRSCQVNIPERGLPLCYILGKNYGKKPISALDIGCGLHLILPLINTIYYRHLMLNHPMAEEFFQVPHPYIFYGVGIDKEARSLERALSSIWPFEGADEKRRQLKNLYHFCETMRSDFPFYQCDVLSVEPYTLRDLNHGRLYHCVFTSFMRHGLNEEQLKQLNDLVKEILRPDGIWVDIGWPIFSPGRQNYVYGVTVVRPYEFTSIPFATDIPRRAVTGLSSDQTETVYIDFEGRF